jgi:quercetin dioxygenase-like cupin family protein
MKKLGPVFVVACVVVFLLMGLRIHGQNTQAAPAVKRNIVFKQDMTIAGREAVMAWVELPAGTREGKHTHPAEVYVFVSEGTVLLQAAGKPDATLKAGDTLYVAPGQVHEVINNSGAPAKLSAVFIAEKGKPLTTKAE